MSDMVNKTFTRAVIDFVKSGCSVVSYCERRERRNLCETCDRLSKGRCLECGCWVTLKTWAEKESCPIGVWK